MAWLDKIDFYCRKHFEERLVVLFDKKHETLLGIINGGATMTFGVIDQDIDTIDCKISGCIDKATHQIKRHDWYERIPEMPKE